MKKRKKAWCPKTEVKGCVVNLCYVAKQNLVRKAKKKALKQRSSTCGSRPPQGSNNPFTGVTDEILQFITITKLQLRNGNRYNFIVGGATTTRGTVSKGHSIRKVGRPCSRVISGMGLLLEPAITVKGLGGGVCFTQWIQTSDLRVMIMTPLTGTRLLEPELTSAFVTDIVRNGGYCPRIPPLKKYFFYSGMAAAAHVARTPWLS